MVSEKPVVQVVEENEKSEK